MKIVGMIAAVVVVVALGVYMLGTDVDVRDSGALPDVNISAENGRMPDVNVNTPDITVKEKSASVKMPEVDVKMEKENVSYPTIDYNAAEDSAIDEAAENDAQERE